MTVDVSQFEIGKNPCVIREFKKPRSENGNTLVWWVVAVCSCGNTFEKIRYKYKNGSNKCRFCSADKKNIVGKRFANMQVLRRENVVKNGYQIYKCLCDCGNEFSLASRAFGRTKSCGCLSKTTTSMVHTKHGMSGTRVYNSWSGMISRSNDIKGRRAKDYALRGISVEDSWRSFENFYRDMGDPPDGHTLDRIDNNKGYSKDNCRWATLSQQQSNRRQKNSISGRIGVNWDKKECSWKVRLRVDKVDIWLGRYKDYDKACKVIEEAELNYLGYSRRDYCV